MIWIEFEGRKIDMCKPAYDYPKAMARDVEMVPVHIERITRLHKSISEVSGDFARCFRALESLV